MFSILSMLALSSIYSQTNMVVIPPGYSTRPGFTTSIVPFSYELARTQVLYRSGAIAKRGGVILSLDFRRDTLVKVAYSSIRRDLEIDAYLTKTAPGTMTTNFAANRGTGPKTTVFNNSTLNLPSLPYPSSPPAPWSVRFKFSRPFPFAVSSGNILFEFICKGPGKTFSRYYMDSEFLKRTPSGRERFLGMYCVGKNREVYKIYPVIDTWILGGKAEIQWKPGASQPTTIISYIGTSKDRWGPIRLPFDLGVLGGISYSRYPCRVGRHWIPGMAVTLKQNIVYGPIPGSPVFKGLTIYTDSFGIAPKANPLGIITGPAFAITIGPGKPPLGDVCVMYSANTITSPTGRLYSTTHYRGPIARLHGGFN